MTKTTTAAAPTTKLNKNLTVEVSAGGEHTLVRQTQSQTLWSAGACGLGWCRNHPLHDALYKLRRVGAVPAVDQDRHPVNDSSERDTHFSQFYASYYHNLAVGATTGRLYSWGCGTFCDEHDVSSGDNSGDNSSSTMDGIQPALGQGFQAKDLGDGPSQVRGLDLRSGANDDDRIVQLAGGAYHSVVLTLQGHVHTFGAGQLGQLGRPIPGTDASLDASGLPVDPIPRKVTGIPSHEKVTDIGSGFYNTLAIGRSGNLYCAGENQNQQCGRGPRNLMNMTRVLQKFDGSPVAQAQGGYCHTLVKTVAGNVFSMGCSEEGQRGVGPAQIEDEDESHESLPTVTPVILPAGQKATQIAAGANHSLVLADDGAAYAFGANDVGQCGIVSTKDFEEGDDDEGEGPIWSPQKVPIPPEAGRVLQVSAGYAHSVVSTASGRVFVFGQNDNGQLGIGMADADEPSRIPVELKVRAD